MLGGHPDFAERARVKKARRKERRAIGQRERVQAPMSIWTVNERTKNVSPAIDTVGNQGRPRLNKISGQMPIDESLQVQILANTVARSGDLPNPVPVITLLLLMILRYSRTR